MRRPAHYFVLNGMDMVKVTVQDRGKEAVANQLPVGGGPLLNLAAAVSFTLTLCVCCTNVLFLHMIIKTTATWRGSPLCSHLSDSEPRG